MKKIELQIDDEVLEQVKIIFSLKHMMGDRGLANAAEELAWMIVDAIDNGKSTLTVSVKKGKKEIVRRMQ